MQEKRTRIAQINKNLRNPCILISRAVPCMFGLITFLYPDFVTSLAALVRNKGIETIENPWNLILRKSL